MAKKKHVAELCGASLPVAAQAHAATAGRPLMLRISRDHRRGKEGFSVWVSMRGSGRRCVGPSRESAQAANKDGPLLLQLIQWGQAGEALAGNWRAGVATDEVVTQQLDALSRAHADGLAVESGGVVPGECAKGKKRRTKQQQSATAKEEKDANDTLTSTSEAVVPRTSGDARKQRPDAADDEASTSKRRVDDATHTGRRKRKLEADTEVEVNTSGAKGGKKAATSSHEEPTTKKVRTAGRGRTFDLKQAEPMPPLTKPCTAAAPLSKGKAVPRALRVAGA